MLPMRSEISAEAISFGLPETAKMAGKMSQNEIKIQFTDFLWKLFSSKWNNQN